MTDYPWYRVYNEVLTDRKILRICRLSGQPKCVIVGVWTTLLALANGSPVRGRLMLTDSQAITLDEISDECGIEMSGIVDQFVALGMVAWDGDALVIVHFADRQFESDTSTVRVREYRKRKCETLPPPQCETLLKRCRNVSVTPPRNVSVTPPDPDPDTDTESDKELATPRKKPRASAPPLPTQIAVFREAAGGTLLPRKATWPAIIKAVPDDEPALTRWREVVTAWMCTPYSPQNINGMLDWFKNGIPVATQQRKSNGRNGGKAQHAPPATAPPPDLQQTNRIRALHGKSPLTQEQYDALEKQ